MSPASQATIIIPARFGSTRFPGKPLEKVAGITVLERVWSIARATEANPRVIVATEDQRIVDHARSFGAEAVLTSDKCENGTERAFDALGAAKIDSDIIINLQGDALLTPPWVLDAMIAEMQADASIDMVTPAVALDAKGLAELAEHKKTAPASGTTVVFDLQRNALYFSKNIIPFLRNQNATPIYRHIGLYGYRKHALQRYVTLPASPLERAEGLEQLRALEHGLKLRVVVVDYKGRTHGSVDAPADVGVVEDIIAREGELISAAG